MLDFLDFLEVLGIYIIGSEFSESDFFDNDLNFCISDEEIEKSEDLFIVFRLNFIFKELVLMVIILFVIRYLLSNEVVLSFVELMKYFLLENKIFQDLSYNKIQEMCGSCNLKVYDYCENCYGFFFDDKDVYSCQIVNCIG